MNIVRDRKRAGLTQADWWNRIGITQSGGSRYEKGDRAIPKPIETLLRLAYGRHGEASRLFAELRRK